MSGCRHHNDCLSCPFPDCIEGVRIKKPPEEKRLTDAERQRKAYQNNPAYRQMKIDYAMNWQKENPEKRRETQRQYFNNRYNNDPAYRERKQELAREYARKRRAKSGE